MVGTAHTVPQPQPYRLVKPLLMQLPNTVVPETTPISGSPPSVVVVKSYRDIAVCARTFPVLPKSEVLTAAAATHFRHLLVIEVFMDFVEEAAVLRIPG